jgi:hypothetical protein
MEDGGVSRSSANTLGPAPWPDGKETHCRGHPGRMTNQRLWEQNCCGADLASGNNVRQR